MEREIHEVEEGRSETLGGGYPRELSGVATNLNALLIGERKRVSALPRHARQSRAQPEDPARGDAREPAGGSRWPAALGGEIDRMNGIIEHQLKRAAASGGALLGQAPVEVAPLAAELRAALLKVYAGKDLAIELAIAPAAQFIGDRGDLTELLGNLLDNACKWCRGRVRLSAAADAARASRASGSAWSSRMTGRASPRPTARACCERGVRADENVPGHGLGLAMVRDTVDLYGGTLASTARPSAGRALALRLPGR